MPSSSKSGSTKPNKKRKASKDPRVLMPKQPISKRIENFREVAFGLTEKLAVQEAKRCLQCKIPKCIAGCPVGIDIKTMIQHIEDREFDDAVRVLKSYTSLPGVCGRVCPQEDQCEKACILGITREPVAIGYLERFLDDYELQKNVKLPKPPKGTGYQVAIV
ncbi:MAG: hypothetical protein ACW976_06805, partial [Candidatus Ranarchaeia archaeon]